jgi:hypothetical protein
MKTRSSKAERIMTDKCCHKVYICSNSNHWQEHIHFLREYYYDTLIYYIEKELLKKAWEYPVKLCICY